MARKRVESLERESTWRGLVDEWRESELMQEAFCRERGVSVASFRWWKWKPPSPCQALLQSAPSALSAKTAARTSQSRRYSP